MKEHADLQVSIEAIAKTFKRLSESSLESLIGSRDIEFTDTEIEETSSKVQQGAYSPYERVKHALTSLLDRLPVEELSSTFQKVVQKCETEVNDPEEFSRRINENETPGAILGFSDAFIESMARVAQDCFARKEYHEASDILWFACSLDPMNGDYWMALGQAEQKAARYSEAIQAYSMNVLLDEDNPKAYFYAAQCSKAMGDVVEAALAVDYALTIAKEDPEFASLIPELQKFQKSLH